MARVLDYPRPFVTAMFRVFSR